MALGDSKNYGPDGQPCPVRTWVGATWSIVGGKAINTPVAGAEEATGALVVGTWYYITASEVDHFYTGSAIGHTFRAAATTALDANNKVQALTLAELPCSLVSSTPSVMATVNYAMTAGKRAGAVLCLDSAASPANFLICYHDGVNLHLDKCVAGTYTSLINTAAILGATPETTISTRRSGANLLVRLYHNSAPVGVETVVSDAGIVDNTLMGLFSTSELNTFSKMTLFPKGNEGQFAEFDRYIK